MLTIPQAFYPILLFLFSAICMPVAASEPVAKSRTSGIAIGGHDTAAYHSLRADPQQSAVPGDKAFIVEYKGAKWQFSSRESSELFAADPERYAPAYNGHCANALSLGEGLIRTDGTHWEIFDDKLYLFFAGRGRDRRLGDDWRQYKQEADTAWQRLSR